MRTHLKTVYSYLTLSVASAAAGSYVSLVSPFFFNLGMLAALASVGLNLALHFTPDNGKNRGQRAAYLLGFAFLSGNYAT